jgi:hypothetical protein
MGSSVLAAKFIHETYSDISRIDICLKFADILKLAFAQKKFYPHFGHFLSTAF